MVDQSVVVVVRKYLQALREQGFPVRFGVVFGSQATGKAHRWSDADLLVVSPCFDGKVSRRDVDTLWHLAARIDSRIEPIPCGERQWQEDGASALIEMARRQGRQVALAEEAKPPAA